MGRGAEDADVVVVGAGFAGLALAHVAAAAGMSVIVLERRSETAIEGAGVTLQANGLSVLERLGVLEEALAVGHRVTVWNRTPGKAKPLTDAGATLATTPAELASAAEAIITILTHAAAIEAVYGGPRGLLAGTV